MPSIDRLVATRYLPTGPHPLARRPWRRAGPAPASTATVPMGERVRSRLAAADRLRARRRLARTIGVGGPALALLAGEAVVLRWPHAGVQTADRLVHTAGTLLIVLTGLRRMRDGLFGPPEMAATAGVVTALLLVLVATGLGFALWSSEAVALGMQEHTLPPGSPARGESGGLPSAATESPVGSHDPAPPEGLAGDWIVRPHAWPGRWGPAGGHPGETEEDR